MASSFFDTSALVKYYHVETGTPEVIRLIEEPQARHVISRLTIVEVSSAFAIKVRTGELTTSTFHHVRQRFLSDVAQGRFRAMPLRQRPLSAFPSGPSRGPRTGNPLTLYRTPS